MQKRHVGTTSKQPGLPSPVRVPGSWGRCQGCRMLIKDWNTLHAHTCPHTVPSPSLHLHRDRPGTSDMLCCVSLRPVLGQPVPLHQEASTCWQQRRQAAGGALVPGWPWVSLRCQSSFPAWPLPVGTSGQQGVPTGSGHSHCRPRKDENGSLSHNFHRSCHKAAAIRRPLHTVLTPRCSIPQTGHRAGRAHKAWLVAQALGTARDLLLYHTSCQAHGTHTAHTQSFGPDSLPDTPGRPGTRASGI